MKAEAIVHMQAGTLHKMRLSDMDAKGVVKNRGGQANKEYTPRLLSR